MLRATQHFDSAQFKSRLQAAGQGELLERLETLRGEDRDRLLSQVLGVDWSALQRVFEQHRISDSNGKGSSDPLSTLVIQAPQRIIPQPQSLLERRQGAAVAHRGQQHLSEGKVAAVMVAGGQGSRLGFPHAKGLFPIGPLSRKTLYQWHAEQLVYWMNQLSCSIPYIIMTSSATHEETVEHFESHEYHGLDPADVWIIPQGELPALDLQTGQALYHSNSQLVMSPNGHGGLLSAFTQHDIWQQLRGRGVETLSYHQVDNPLSKLCDPVFIGWHLLHRADVSTKVARKRHALERMGLVLEVNNIVQVVEYSDLSDDVAAMTDDQGELRFWAGNTAMHLFDVSFLENVARLPEPLPLHLAEKAVAFSNGTQEIVPTQPNAAKFEKFIFDVLPQAQRPLFVEIDRDQEFAPMKNRSGDDSPATCRQAVIQLHRMWLREVGVFVPDAVDIEISPRVAQRPEDLRDLLPAGTTLLEPTLLNSTDIEVYS